MPFAHSKAARLYANGYDLSAYVKRVSTPARVDVADVSALGATSKSYVTGLLDAMLNIEGLFDPDAGAIHDVLKSALGTETNVNFAHLPQGGSQGGPATGFAAKSTTYEAGTGLDDAGRLTIDSQSDVAAEALKTHHVKQTEAAAGQSAAVNNGASSANGGVAYLQAIGAGPIAAVTVKIQHSVDNITYVDLITFTAFTDRAHERKAVTGTVNQYTIAQWSAGSTIPFWVGFGRK